MLAEVDEAIFIKQKADIEIIAPMLSLLIGTTNIKKVMTVDSQPLF
jgi:hypothetical protein